MTDQSVFQMAKTQTSTASVPLRPTRGRPPIPGLRDRILRAAEAVFTGSDYHEVQMDDVARKCGVGKGTLYRYFPGKRELYLAVMFEGIERLRQRLEAVASTDEPPIRKLEQIVRETLGYFWERRSFFALIHQHEHRPDGDAREWLRQRARLTGFVHDILAQAAAAGEMRAVDAHIATEMLFGLIRAANRYRRKGDTLEAMVAAVIDIFVRGVGTTGARRRISARDGREE